MIRFTAYKELQSTEGRMALEVALEVDKGELVALYGDSGAGKTTTLRLIAGLTDSKKINTEVDESYGMIPRKDFFYHLKSARLDSSSRTLHCSRILLSE